MTQRPVFLAQLEVGPPLVRQVLVSFTWHPGFAPSQKKKNVMALHVAAEQRGITPLLEVSTKSDEPLGIALSAFNLQVGFAPNRTTAIEVAYQASKVFEHRGPFVDLYSVSPHEAKRDARLRSSGPLIGFVFGGNKYPLDPPTAFYDWIYLRALVREPALVKAMSEYVGFTDIEFNPATSLNCQARSCATAVSLFRRGELRACARSFARFSAALSSERRDVDSVVAPTLPLY